jgi:hypothetical protein
MALSAATRVLFRLTLPRTFTTRASPDTSVPIRADERYHVTRPTVLIRCPPLLNGE